MIDMGSEQLRPLSRASADVPGRPHVSTLVRWALRGVKGVKLETIVIGGRRFTSVEAIRRFVGRLSADAGGRPGPPSPNAARVAGRLDEAGF